MTSSSVRPTRGAKGKPMAIKKREVLHEGKYIRMLGQDGWEFVQRKNCTGMVMMIGMTQDERVVLIEQYRVPVGRRAIEFPAGLVNDLGHIKNETLEQAALREYEEETGYRAEKMVPLFKAPANSALSSDLFTLFKAVGLKKCSAGGGDDSENITVHEIPFEKVRGWLGEMQKKEFLVDAKVYTGLYFLREDLHGNLGGVK